MALSKIDLQELKELEEALWRTETRFDLAFQERVFAPDFFEFGRSGRVYTRAQMIFSGGEEIRAQLPLENFAIREIDEQTVQITYISQVQYEALERANRSSIWSRAPNGWQLRFHQGTAL